MVMQLINQLPLFQMSFQAPANKENASNQTSGPSGADRAQTPSKADVEDQRPQTVLQRKLETDADDSPQEQLTTQLRSSSGATSPPTDTNNSTSSTGGGLPSGLKSGVEQLSGYAMDDVKVHYNSGKPAQLRAMAFAQGTDIHLGPGQEKHLAHEAWHVVQQKQGRVRPTTQFKSNQPINDEPGLEREADLMGARVVETIKVGLVSEKEFRVPERSLKQARETAQALAA